MSCGIFVKLMTNDMIDETPIRKITTELVRAAAYRMRGRSVTLIAR